MAQVYPGGGYPVEGTLVGDIPDSRPIRAGGNRPVRASRCRGAPARSKDSARQQAGDPLPNFRGNLKVFDDKTVSVELGDKRVMDFRRDGKTKFFKSGDEVKTPKFNLGDQVSVEAHGRPRRVHDGGQRVLGEGRRRRTTSKTDDGVVDTWKDDPPPKDRSGVAKSAPTRHVTKAPAPRAMPTTPVRRS